MKGKDKEGGEGSLALVSGLILPGFGPLRGGGAVKTIDGAGVLGSRAPQFHLPAVDGRKYANGDFPHEVLVVMFICNHCPYVKAVEERLIKLGRLFREQASFLAISSNDPVRYPEDSFEAMHKIWSEKNYPFPYLFDKSQEAARRFGARCTPDVFVYDRERTLAYRGLIDDNWKDIAKVSRSYLRDALDALLRGERPDAIQEPSLGCSIKWTY
jgi:peroxiredoxin